MKLKSTDGRRWALFVKYDIPDVEHPDEVYLRRWRIIQTPYFGVYLHKIMLPDGDRLVHNHPWDFRALILLGGYTEIFQPWIATKQRKRHWSRFGIRKMYRHSFHSIIELDRTPTWTLLFVGKRAQDWGFLHPDGTIQPHAEYLAEHYA